MGLGREEVLQEEIPPIHTRSTGEEKLCIYWGTPRKKKKKRGKEEKKERRKNHRMNEL